MNKYVNIGTQMFYVTDLGIAIFRADFLEAFLDYELEKKNRNVYLIKK